MRSRGKNFSSTFTSIPGLPDAIPFVFKYYERDWGLCCSRKLKDSLRDDRYRVVIRSEFSYGTLKVGEVIVPGKSAETFILCAHLCHPAMVNDDLSGVVVGLKVMQELLKRRNLRYTYRFLDPAGDYRIGGLSEPSPGTHSENDRRPLP